MWIRPGHAESFWCIFLSIMQRRVEEHGVSCMLCDVHEALLNTIMQKTIELILSIRKTVRCLVDAVSPTLSEETKIELHKFREDTDRALAELIAETEEHNAALRRTLAELEALKK